MTTEERAEKLIREWSALAHHSGLNSIQQQMAREIAREMNTVIAEHNEQCAQVADREVTKALNACGYGPGDQGRINACIIVSGIIAKDIRALLTSPAPDGSSSPSQEIGGSEGS